MAAADEKKTPATSAAADQIERWRSALDSVRGRADLTAKALAAIATTAIGAVGLAKIQDIFPSDWSFWRVVAAIAAVAGLIAFAWVVVSFLGRLTQVNAPVATSTRSAPPEDLNDDERAILDRIGADAAAAKGVSSLRAYEARATRLERVAERSDSTRATELRARAEEIRVDVRAALGEAAADIVRRRAAHAFTETSARALYVAGIAGLLLFALGTDYLDGERNGTDAITKTQQALRKDRVAIAKDCADMGKAYADQGLKPVLDPSTCPSTITAPTTTPPAPKTATADEEAAGAIQDLGSRLVNCVAAIRNDEDGKPLPADVAACDHIRRVLARTASTGRGRGG